MQDAKLGDLGRDLAKVETLEKIYELLPLSQARANLSQLVDRVAYTGQPVLIAKHGTARAACVPLSMLSQAAAQFVAAAERSIAQHIESPAEDHDNDVDFEEVPGLRAAELQATRARVDAEAKSEDLFDDEMILQIVNHPKFTAQIKDVILHMAYEQAKAESSKDSSWPQRSAGAPVRSPVAKPAGTSVGTQGGIAWRGIGVDQEN